METTNNISKQNWVNTHRDLLRKYRGKWIARNAETVLASAETGENLMQIIKNEEITDYVILYVQPTWFSSVLRFATAKMLRTALAEA